MLFRGSDAVAAGQLSRAQLRGPLVTRLFRDVYVDRSTPVTHEVRCRGATLFLPPDAVVTGRSAAAVRGAALAAADDPVEIIAPLGRRIARREGFDLRRNEIAPGEWVPWHGGRLATPLRMALDLALDRPVAVAVADLDVVLRRGLVDLDALGDLVHARSDRGIRVARRAVSLVDPRAESRPESEVRVHLVLAGLDPVPQHWIEDADGPIARTDLGFPERRVQQRCRTATGLHEADEGGPARQGPGCGGLSRRRCPRRRGGAGSARSRPRSRRRSPWTACRCRRPPRPAPRAAGRTRAPPRRPRPSR